MDYIPVPLSEVPALAVAFSLCAMLTHHITDSGDELRVGRLSFGGAYCVAEIVEQNIIITSAPRILDGVTDGSLHPAGGVLKFLCDRRIKLPSDSF